MSSRPAAVRYPEMLNVGTWCFSFRDRVAVVVLINEYLHYVIFVSRIRFNIPVISVSTRSCLPTQEITKVTERSHCCQRQLCPQSLHGSPNVSGGFVCALCAHTEPLGVQALLLSSCRGSSALSLCHHSEGWLRRKLLTVVLCKICLLTRHS